MYGTFCESVSKLLSPNKKNHNKNVERIDKLNLRLNFVSETQPCNDGKDVFVPL